MLAWAESEERARRAGVAAAGRWAGGRGTMQVKPVAVCRVMAPPKEPKVAWKPRLRERAVLASYECTGQSGSGSLARPVGALSIVAATVGATHAERLSVYEWTGQGGVGARERFVGARPSVAAYDFFSPMLRASAATSGGSARGFSASEPLPVSSLPKVADEEISEDDDLLRLSRVKESPPLE